MAVQLPHCGKLIRARLEELGMTKSEFSRRLKTSPQNVYGIFKRKSCDVKLLYNISVILNLDFMQYFSTDALSAPGAKSGSNIKTVAQLMGDVDRLQKEYDTVANENSMLKQIVNLQKEVQAKNGK